MRFYLTNHKTTAQYDHSNKKIKTGNLETKKKHKITRKKTIKKITKNRSVPKLILNLVRQFAC